MNAEEFVEVIRREVRDSAVEGTVSILTAPPGRRPAPALLAMSAYYNSKSAEEQAMIRHLLEEVADSAVFGFFCVLDGVRAIEGMGEKGTLSLTYKKGDVEVCLNIDEDLHDFYNAV
ncbi:hypothetical protein [Corticimicrobacter populi]|uniref:Uncharacterized protein n=1 Tax=Corticimicrobacter populi TaxID=2175229 RepID=A0A2V1K1G4_9BURK|nr:hypothetical protein [Corticimicrobacter populi]PWF21842.1 hypothetical protein DD235_13675 [Corticimicrobacter populi]